MTALLCLLGAHPSSAKVAMRRMIAAGLCRVLEPADCPSRASESASSPAEIL